MAKKTMLMEPALSGNKMKARAGTKTFYTSVNSKAHNNMIYNNDDNVTNL